MAGKTTWLVQQEQEILSTAQEHLKHSLTPKLEIDVSPFWRQVQMKEREEIPCLHTIRDVISYAQTVDNTYFEHRKIHLDSWAITLIHKKLEEVEKRFPEFDLYATSIQESIYSIKSSLYHWKGRYLSTILFWHLNCYLACRRWLCNNPRNVLEIGGGYGALARLFKLENPGMHYTIIDLAESLFFTEVFLRACFPYATITYLTNPSQEKEGDFLLVPVDLCDSLKDRHFDLAISQSSMHGMPENTMKFWMDFIQQGDVDGFYSLNYFLNPLSAALGSANHLCPVCDSFWEVKHWELNPTIIRMDAPEGWLEVCLRRQPRVLRNHEEKPILASLLAEEARQSGGSDRLPGTESERWLAYLWQSVWLNRDPDVLWKLFSFCARSNYREALSYGRMLMEFQSNLQHEYWSGVRAFLDQHGISIGM